MASRPWQARENHRASGLLAAPRRPGGNASSVHILRVKRAGRQAVVATVDPWPGWMVWGPFER